MHRNLAQASVDAELAWLAGQRAEPAWPEFPSKPAYVRPGIYLSGGPPERGRRRRRRAQQYVDHQGAALWITCTRTIADVRVRPWLREVASAYGRWTADANGAGLETHEDVANPPHEWNNAYFKLVADCLPSLTTERLIRWCAHRLPPCQTSRSLTS